jgi:hypothetical protein
MTDNKQQTESNNANVLLCDELLAVLNGSFGVAINLSDFFNYACADMRLIDTKDLYWVLPMYKKYGWDGVYAAVSFIAKQMPIKPHINDKFKEAYAEIEKINPEVHSEY